MTRAELHASVLTILASAYAIETRCVMTDNAEWLLRFRPDPDHKPGWFELWILTDNGGEYNLAPANRDEEMVSVPYERWSLDLDPGTIAYRLVQAFAGEPIDYAYCEDPTIAEVYG